MLILIRLVLFPAILLIAVSCILFLVTREPRYAGFAWQVARFVLYAILVLGALFLLERYGLVAWRVWV